MGGARSVHLFALGDVGELIGGVRLSPTWRPHKLDTVFADFVENRARARGPDIWEISAWTFETGPQHRAGAGSTHILLRALEEFAFSRGVQGFVGCVELARLNAVIELGGAVEFLGSPRLARAGYAVAVRWDLGGAAYPAGDRPAAVELSAWADPGPEAALKFALIHDVMSVADPALLEAGFLTLSEMIDGAERGEGLGALAGRYIHPVAGEA